LKLEKPEIKVKEVKLSKDISSIEREELEVKAFIINSFIPFLKKEKSN